MPNDDLQDNFSLADDSANNDPIEPTDPEEEEVEVFDEDVKQALGLEEEVKPVKPKGKLIVKGNKTPAEVIKPIDWLPQDDQRALEAIDRLF